MTFDIAPFRQYYPWTGRFLDVGGGVRMHYLDEGAGDPVLMLHGNPTWSFYYRHLVRALAPTHRTIVPDHVGCGLSDKPGDDRYEYRLARRARDLELLIDSLRLDRKLTLVLHDWGGMIGLVWAMRHLERIERIVLLNTAGFGLPEGRILPWQIAIIRHLPGLLSSAVRGLNAFALGAAHTCSTVPGRMTPEIRRAYLAPYDSWRNRIAVQRFVEDIPLQPGDPSWELVEGVKRDLPRLASIPVLICWGGRDFVFDDHFLEEWRRRVPHAEIHRFDDAGHYVLEDAHERIVPLVQRFLGVGERRETV